MQPYVSYAIRKRLGRDLLTTAAGKLSFETVTMAAYKEYELRLTAVGYGSVYSSWSTSAVAGGSCRLRLEALDTLAVSFC